MPNYNGERFIKSAMESVLVQTYGDFELVVVDDGSIDSSVSVVEGLASSDVRVKLFRHSRNKGLSAALNTGIGKASAPFVTFMGSDDLFAPERLERIIRLSQGRRTVVYCDVLKVDESAVSVGSVQSGWMRPSGMLLGDLLLWSTGDTGSATGPPLPGPLSAPKALFEEAGLYDETLTYGEDFDMIYRLASMVPFTYDEVISYGYRRHPGSSFFVRAKKERYEQYTRVLEKCLVANWDALDKMPRRAALSALLWYCVASKQYTKALKLCAHGIDSLSALWKCAGKLIR
jgi:glycosyltransferase involved in cell wall biosynthesis